MLSSYTPYVITRLVDRREELPVHASTPSRRPARRRTPRPSGQPADH
jgi:hypothetical protein